MPLLSRQGAAQALAARRDAGHQQTLATTKGGGKAGGKGGGKNGKPKAKAKAKAKAKSKAGAKPPGTVCPFFAKNGSCRKGANCDMVHSLVQVAGYALAVASLLVCSFALWHLGKRLLNRLAPICLMETRR